MQIYSTLLTRANIFDIIFKKSFQLKEYHAYLQKKELNMTYKERLEQEKAFVVVLDCTVVGTFRNLKKLCEEMKERDAEFRSYSSLSKRRDDENPITFETGQGEYKVYIEKLK